MSQKADSRDIASPATSTVVLYTLVSGPLDAVTAELVTPLAAEITRAALANVTLPAGRREMATLRLPFEEPLVGTLGGRPDAA